MRDSIQSSAPCSAFLQQLSQIYQILLDMHSSLLPLLLFNLDLPDAKIDTALQSQFGAGRLYACISSRPGQSGRADGYILEGKELEFYVRKLRTGKMKHAHAA